MEMLQCVLLSYPMPWVTRYAAEGRPVAEEVAWGTGHGSFRVPARRLGKPPESSCVQEGITGIGFWEIYGMALNLRSFFNGPEWAEISVPEWFRERAAALIAQLGDDHPDVQLFKDLLAAGRIEQEAVQRAGDLAGTTKNPDVFLLAVDIATHSFLVLQLIAQMVPLRQKAA
ncbi:hypothetical protein [Candidatus Methylocalor cossyra]